MAKATVVFEDNPGGGITMKATFDPAIETGDNPTAAQSIVLAICQDVGEVVDSALYWEGKVN